MPLSNVEQKNFYDLQMKVVGDGTKNIDFFDAPSTNTTTLAIESK